MRNVTDLVVDGEALEAHIQTLGAIGVGGAGSLFRPVYSRAWSEAQSQICAWMEEAGLATRVDAAGNLIGRLNGRADGPAVVTGSHIDTVRDGGKYDGALGVLAGIAAVAALRAAGLTSDRPIEVIALCEEEASRFTSAFWGSRAIFGLIGKDEPEAITDHDGVSVRQAMAAVGLDADQLPRARRTDIAAFLELHIEQGRILEAERCELGIVEAITGLRQLAVDLTGHQDHAGTTPMDLRSDAVAGAAEAILALEDLARHLGRPAVATVGRVSALPGGTNVIAGHVSFTVDLRHSDPAVLETLISEAEHRIRSIAHTRRLGIDIQVLGDHRPTPLSVEVAAAIDRAAQAERVKAKRMVSGAGHDSQIFARSVPTGMIFTPSRDGVSHNPLEFTPIEQIVPCVRVLARALTDLASS